MSRDVERASRMELHRVVNHIVEDGLISRGPYIILADMLLRALRQYQGKRKKVWVGKMISYLEECLRKHQKFFIIRTIWELYLKLNGLSRISERYCNSFGDPLPSPEWEFWQGRDGVTGERIPNAVALSEASEVVQQYPDLVVTQTVKEQGRMWAIFWQDKRLQKWESSRYIDVKE